MTQEYFDKIFSELKQENSSEKTAKIYNFFINKYAAFLEEKGGSISQSGQEDVKKFFESLSSYSSKSQSLAISALNFF